MSPDLEDFRAGLKPGMRLLGLDPGSRRIGIALSDRTLTVATPMEILQKKKFSEEAAHIKSICDSHGVGGLVIGLPKNMDGSEGPRCQSARQFARNLSSILPLPILFWDERLSTAAVERTLLEADVSRAKRASAIDKMAAAYILQGALDALRHAV